MTAQGSMQGAGELNHVPDVAALRESERRFHAVWHFAADAMALSDPEGTVTAANPAYFELYGFGPEDIIGQSFAVIFPPGERAAAVDGYRQTFAAEEIAPVVEAVIRRADGTERWVEVRYAFLMEEQQRTAMLSIIRDVTERKRLESEQLEFQHRKDDFLVTVSHDLKSPLTSIKGRAQLLKRRLLRGDVLDSTEIAEQLTEIEQTVTRMTTLVDGLLDTAANDVGGKLDIRSTSTDLAALVRHAVAQAQHGSDRHALVLQEPDDQLIGNWDRDRLERVVENLLSNAIAFSPAGGEISVRLARDEVHETPWAVLTIEDHGVGIPAHDLPHIFERFHRGANVAGRIPGTGIGLSGSKQIVEQHGGTLQIDSVENRGTSVTVRLPLAAGDTCPAN